MKVIQRFKAGRPGVLASRLTLLAIVLGSILAPGVVSIASADAPDFGLTPEAVEEGIEKSTAAVNSQAVDSDAAKELPHSDLDRAQALELISAVFGVRLEGVAGVFDDLSVERFLSDYAAVIAPEDQPEESGITIGQEQTYDGPTLIESTVPLRTEDGLNDEATVDLDLEHAEGEVQPSAPLVDIEIPSELGDGITLPETGVQIELEGAPAERSPSIVDGTVAVYPEVAEDTSFAVAPSPTGFETFTILQSPDAPLSETYGLTLPIGAVLTAASDGGAEVSKGGEPILRVFPPAAMDAEGNDVPVSLSVSGSSFTVQAEPSAEAVHPILVDPVVETYGWYDNNNKNGLGSAWLGFSSNQGLLYNTNSALGLPGTDIRAVKGFTLSAGSEAKWVYSVPRLAADEAAYGTPPTSYVSEMVLSDLFFVTNEDKDYYPIALAGIWNEGSKSWTPWWTHGGDGGNIGNFATTYTLKNASQNAKQAVSAGMWTSPSHKMTSDREMYTGSATVSVADALQPSIGAFSPPTKWVNQTGSAIPFTISDSGLGVREVEIVDTADAHDSWTTERGCSGTVASPCPRTWKDTDSGSPALEYDPGDLPQGIRKMRAISFDPVANKSAPYEFNLKVDHTAPSVALSGALTEQAKFGPRRPSYVLTTTNTDGTTPAPQSGIASTEIKIDGKVVDSTNAGCGTQNCSVSRSWTLDATKYAAGKHTVVVKATDGVGLSTEKTLNIELQPDTTDPTIENYSDFYDASSGWVEQELYELLIIGWDYDYGLESLEFKMDGKVVDSVKEPCPGGGCSEWLNVPVDISAYKGGAHTAAIVATDGAGNVSTESWTVNVNPEGEVSAAEAIDTLEAVEATGDVVPVAPTLDIIDPAEVEEGNNPELEQSGTELTSTGTGATTATTTAPADGVTIESAEGNIEIDPTGADEASDREVTEGVAAVSGGSNVDTVVRPIYDGIMSYQSIRDSSAPEKYSWEVSLNEGQALENIDAQHVAIFNEDGTQALAITAEPSHDATGKAVPTEVAASEGNVLTLTVKHRNGGFVYPVVGGPAFQASYELTVYTPPEEKEEEIATLVHGMSYTINVSAPQFAGCPGEDEACASGGAPYKTYGVPACSPAPVFPCSVWEWHMRGFFYYNGLQAWMSKRQPKCTPDAVPTFSLHENYCKWVGPDHQPYGNGYHITSQSKWEVTGDQGITNTTSTKYLTVRMFGSGNAYPHATPNICNPSRPDC